MKDVTVTGIIQANNEFPLVLFSISHALHYHVDDIILLNHNTDDATTASIEGLKHLFPNRIRVINYLDKQYLQEAATNILLDFINASENHWVYLFDADEFLITKEMKPLKQYIQSADEFNIIHLPVYNYISYIQFDEYLLESYSKLIYRAEPMVFHHISDKIISRDIENGYINYFDLPFSSKIIFQSNEFNWISAGSHYLKFPEKQYIHSFEENELYIAHLPLLSYRRLQLKVEQGRKLMQAGFPASHGWQSQMLYRLSNQDKLKDFWTNHSIQKEELNGDIRYSIDYNLSNSLKPICDLLKNEFGDKFEKTQKTNNMKNDIDFDFRNGVNTVRKFQIIADSLRQKLYEAEENDKRKEQDYHIQTRNLKREIDLLNNSLIESINYRNDLLNSKSWKITKPLRFFSERAKGFISRF